MAIRFTCGCGKRLRAADGQAGRRATCPRCGTALTVPARPAAAAAAPAPPPRVDPTTTVVIGAVVMLLGGAHLALDLAEKRTPFYLAIVFEFAFGLWLVVRGLTRRG